MRFIRKKKIITTAADVNIHDEEKIKKLLNALKSHLINFSLSIKIVTHSGGEHISNYPDVRVEKVNEDSADFMVFQNSNFIKIKDVSFDNIWQIDVVYTRDNIFREIAEDDSSNKFDHLDI